MHESQIPTQGPQIGIHVYDTSKTNLILGFYVKSKINLLIIGLRGLAIEMSAIFLKNVGHFFVRQYSSSVSVLFIYFLFENFT